MLRRLIGEDVELVTQLDASLGNIHADPGRVEQVIMNLVVNSRDAMPRGGRLVIETSNTHLDPAYASRHPDARPGPYVMLSVADTGVGMSHNVLSRIFEPFFTTKDAGKGTGLGLSTVYGIVRQSDGHIVVESAPGAGAIFRVFFPRIDETVMMTETPTPYIAQGGYETVLLVEDDDAVRELTRQILEMNGYKVLEAHSANEALTICRTYAGVIACVLADVVMPQISGPDMVRQLVDIRPRLKAVYMSGYNDHQLLPQTAHTEQPVLLNKPFTPEMLAKTVRSVLDGSAGSQ
jgi:two-component system cell cycle sensor histidine kinase/response regulator CckA